MIIKCENCGKQWVHEREYAYIAPYCSYRCAHSKNYSEYHRVRKEGEKAYRLTDAERKRQELIDNPEFLEID